MSADLTQFVAVLGWALVHFLWQGALIGAVAALLLALLRNARPQSRYLVACLALALCLALPLLALVRGLAADTSLATIATSGVSTTPAAVIELREVPLASWRTSLQGQLPWIVAVWSLGAALLSLRMALGVAWVGRITRATSRSLHPDWQARLDRLAARLGMQRAVGLRVADDLDSPVAAGWWRPIVIVPAALVANMPVDLLEALLAHELAHIKRHDYLVNLLQSAIEALLFYHPVVWWLSRRIRIEREQIADDLAASALGEPRRLALALQELDRFQFSTPHLAPAAHGGNLMSRIQRLIRPSAHATSWKMALPMLGLTAVCFAVYAQGIATRPATAVSAVAPITTVTAAAGVATAPSAAVASTPATSTTPAIAATPATPAVAATPAIAARDGYTRISNNARDSYALVRADGERMMFSGDTRDLREIEGLRRQADHDFVWFQRDGKSYVLRDPAIVARVFQAWKPTEALSGRMEALSAQMEPHSKKMEELSRQMEAISQRGEPNSAEMQRLSVEMEGLGRQQQALSQRMQPLAEKMRDTRDETQQNKLQAQMQALQTQMEALSTKMETLSGAMQAQSEKLEASHRPMQALSQQMQAASEPMQALGQQMEVLGKQQEQLSRKADREMQSLINQAVRDGQAVPIGTPALN